MSEEEQREVHPMAVAIRDLRKAQGLSQKELAARNPAALSPSMVAYYERSTNPLAPAVVQIVANVLGVPRIEIEKFANVPRTGPQKKRTMPYQLQAHRMRESESSFTKLMASEQYARPLTRTPDMERYAMPDVQLAWEFWEHSRAKYEYASLLQQQKKGR